MTDDFKLQDIEIGQTCSVEIGGEWYGAVVTAVEREEGKTNWISAKLHDAPLHMNRGDIATGLNDTEFVDFDGERIYPRVELCSVLVMRSDRGKFGSESISLGSGSTIQKAADDTLTRFHAGEEAQFTQTPEAVQALLEKGWWASPDRKTQYYFKF